MTAASFLDVTSLRDLPAAERDCALAEVSATLEGKPARDIAAWAASVFGTDVIVAASMQDVILPHLFAQVIPGVQVLFLQTGYHFAETLLTRDVAARDLAINVIEAMPRQSLAEQDAEYGEKLHDRDPNLCCFLRQAEEEETARSRAKSSANLHGSGGVPAMRDPHSEGTWT